MEIVKSVISFLSEHQLILTTAESCTAGRIVAMLGMHPGCGECLESGYVVYSETAKKRILGVSQKTIEQFTLTSEEVAREMVTGALRDSEANIGVATTGILGKKPMDGKKPGTVCLAWAAFYRNEIIIHSETIHLQGSRKKMQKEAAEYALKGICSFYNSLG